MLLWQHARERAIYFRERIGKPGGPLTDEYLEKIAALFETEIKIQQLKAGVSGAVFKDEDAPATIFISSEEVHERQRFTIAHEIGHLVERAEIAKDNEYSFIDYRGGTEYDLHEFYADEFAGELLMPAKTFLQDMEMMDEVELALHYHVSIPAVRKRQHRLERSKLKLSA